MTPFLTRLMGIAIVICVVGLLLALAVGRSLPPEDEIMFAANMDKRDFEIYRMTLSRGLTAALTQSEESELGPAWSPDGQQIVFSSSSDQRSHIYIMNAYGGEVRLLMQSEDSEFNPAWSPDGEYITYDRLIYIFSSMLMMTHIQTGEATFLTDGDSSSSAATWLPNDDLIAFTADPNEIGIQNIYTVDVELDAFTDWV